MTTQIQCQFLEKVNLGNEAKPDWEFSKIECDATTTDTYTLIQNATTGAEFYVEKTLSYGDAMILWFLTMFSFYLIFKVAYNFFWKK